MSEEQMPSGQPNVDASGTNPGDNTNPSQSPSGDNKVAYETYSKVLGEKKAKDAQLKTMQERLDELELQGLKGSEDKDAYINKLQESLVNLRSEHKSTRDNYAKTQVKSQVASAASKLGCQDVDALAKLMDIGNVPFDPDTFRADDASIMSMIEAEKNIRPYLFSKSAPTIHDVSPSNTLPPQGGSKKEYSQMTREELKAELSSVAGEKFEF